MRRVVLDCALHRRTLAAGPRRRRKHPLAAAVSAAPPSAAPSRTSLSVRYLASVSQRVWGKNMAEGLLGRLTGRAHASEKEFEVSLEDEAWRKKLTPEQYR